MATTDPHRLELELIDDLATLAEQFTDRDFCRELYRTLTNMQWSKRGWDGHLSLSWRRAEEIIDALREGQGREPLALAGSGGEGQPCPRALQALERLGWTGRPLDTSEHDEAHVTSPPDPPPPDAGQRHAPVAPEAARWEERAHREAELERLRRRVGEPAERLRPPPGA
jgi:hypothetical protein